MRTKPNVRGGGRRDREIAGLKKKVADQDEQITELRALVDKQNTVIDEAIEQIQAQSTRVGVETPVT